MPTVHCSCCGRSKVDVSHMIAGPNVYLCERCVAQAARQLAPGRLAPGRPAADAVRCRFCHQRRATGEVTTVGSVIVCADCLGIMTSILTEATQPSRPAT
jgi:ClpX C4-type zinc finger protein